MNFALRPDLRPIRRVVRMLPALALLASSCTPETEVAILPDSLKGCVKGERTFYVSDSSRVQVVPIKHELRIAFARLDRSIILESNGTFASITDPEFKLGDSVELMITLRASYRRGNEAARQAAELDLQRQHQTLLKKRRITLDATEQSNRLVRTGAMCEGK